MSLLTVPVGLLDHVRGDPYASLTLLEYGDYECGFCRQAFDIVRRIQQELGDTLRFVFRNFPLTQVHLHAFDSACAAEAAGLQGKFWEMHDALYEPPNNLDNESLLRYARMLKLNMKRFVADMASEDISQKIRADFMSAIRSGVNGTPTFFINGKRLDGSYKYPALLDRLQSAAKETSYG
jgi:protein-disulfide isomerase